MRMRKCHTERSARFRGTAANLDVDARHNEIVCREVEVFAHLRNTGTYRQTERHTHIHTLTYTDIQAHAHTYTEHGIG